MKKNKKQQKDSKNNIKRLRQIAENIMKKTSNEEDMGKLSHKDLSEIIHELKVHQIELELQNKELNKSQSEAEVSKEKFENLYDFSPISYFSLNIYGIIRQVNLTGTKILNEERKNLINAPLTNYIDPSYHKIFFEHLNNTMYSNDVKTCELELLATNNNRYCVRLYSIKYDEKVYANDDDIEETGSYRNISKIQTAIIDLTEIKSAKKISMESEEKYKILFDNIQDAVFLVQKDTGHKRYFVDVNKTACKMFGYTKEEIINMNPDRLFITDREDLQKTLCNENNDVIEVKCRSKEGKMIPVELRSQQIHYKNQGMVLCIAHDITERVVNFRNMKWESSLNEALAELSKLILSKTFDLQSVTDIVCAYAKKITGSQQGYVSTIDKETGDNVVHTFTKMMGAHVCKVSDAHDRKIRFQKTIHGDYGSLWGYALNEQKSFYTNNPFNHPASKGLPKGHLPLESFLSVPVIINNDLVGQIAVANSDHDYNNRDIEAVKRLAELFAVGLRRIDFDEKLRKSEASYRAVVEDQTELICRYKKDTTLTFVNDAYCRYFGFDKDKIIGKKTGELLNDRIPIEDIPKSMEQYSKISPENPVVTIKHRYITPDNDIRWHKWIVRGLVNESGKIEEYQGVGMDITNEKLAEESLKKTMNKLRHTNEELESFAHTVSHDLRNPLNVVISYLNIINQDYSDHFDEEGKELTEQVMDRTYGMLDLIQSLLSYTKIDGNFEDLGICDLNEALNNAIGNLTILLNDHDALIEKDELPKVIGDKIQLTSVFQNLIENAIKYRSKERPLISISHKTLNEDAVISISDNGIGIDSKEQEHIFNIFHRADKNSKQSGYGIGLALTKKIITNHNGKIFLESESGKGSTFYITLKLPS